MFSWTFPCQDFVNLQDIDGFARSNALMLSILRHNSKKMLPLTLILFFQVNPSPLFWKLTRDCWNWRLIICEGVDKLKVYIWASFFSVVPFPLLTTNQRPPVVTHPMWSQSLKQHEVTLIYLFKEHFHLCWRLIHFFLVIGLSFMFP
jgi:hypothetical protein